ncbi:MAG: cytoplasmic protein [Nitrospirae bacterium]|nr:MAG: cytoplasmic protein [Nitrospirota bacterium]
MILDALRPDIAMRIEPFFREILSSFPEDIHVLAVTGSAVTPDFDKHVSNINSVILLRTMSLDFVRFLAPLGGKYRDNRIAAPLVMTAEYVRKSLDVFPVEFLDLKLLHRTVFGEDVFGALSVHTEYLRIQCEREIKTKLLALWQGYIAHLGQKDAVADLLIRSVKNMFPLLRGILLLMGTEPPISRREVIAVLENHIPLDRDALELVLSFRHQAGSLTEDIVRSSFERHYRNLEIISDAIELSAIAS